MFTWFRESTRRQRTASELYGAVVAQARNPAFYADGGIPDTAEGRFELIVLNLFLVLERLKVVAANADDVSRALLETFVTDMDDNLREMGVGDLSVPKKVKKAAAGFYDRAVLFRQVLAAGSGAADQAVISDLGAALGTSEAAGVRLTNYLRAAHTHLAAVTDGDCLAGRISFPVVAVPGQRAI